MADRQYIRIRGARAHNLRDINLDIPRDKLVVVTGLSGSGKSSLAFDTIFAEGQRRYVESLSAYARQFLEQMQKPDVEHIEGLPPTIAIEQRSGVASPRSTVATTTEIYDYLRLLFARAGEPYCYQCGRPITQQSPEQIVKTVLAIEEGTRVMILAPLVRGRKGEHREVLKRVQREGFVRARIDGIVTDLRNVGALHKNRKHDIEAVVDRLTVRRGIASRMTDSVEIALKLGEGMILLSIEQDGRWRDSICSELYACAHCGISYEELQPNMFSFNSPYGACPACDGLGTRLEFDPELIVPDKGLSLREGAIEVWRRGGKRMAIHYHYVLREFCDDFDVNPDTAFEKLSKDVRRTLLCGTEADPRAVAFEGVIPNCVRRFKRTTSEYVKKRLHEYMSELPCAQCHGARLRPESLAVRVGDKAIHAITRMSVTEALQFLKGLKLGAEKAVIAEPILKEVKQRLRFMADVGIGYLTLDRTSATLAGGEAQRIRLASQVGSGLVGVCYVLDEPTIGLHQRDNRKLIDTLLRLRDLGNTVLVVEHDEASIRAADHIIDLGPGAGARGGEVVAQGTLDDVLREPKSLTGRYLSRELSIPTPERRRRVNLKHTIQVKGARENNLKSLDVAIPLGVFCCVTGVSGSGKSTLVQQILRPALARKLSAARRMKPGAHSRILGAHRIDKVIEIDQSPIGRTPRSNPGTYTKVFDEIRRVFSQVKHAKIRGYAPGRFSFNVKGGRCDACQGQGVKEIEMHFLPDVFVTCEECRGKRYNRETLEIRFKGRNIAEVLAMPVVEARDFFANFPKIKRMLQTLVDVGLGYLALGQSSATLSGGEAQRVKLAAELGRAATGNTLYILDEPTTGLHFADISRLLDVLGRLTDAGNTVLVIEHNLDVIKTADYIIDLGPEGGDAGGRVVVAGPPEKVMAHATSYTGKFLRDHLAAERRAAEGVSPTSRNAAKRKKRRKAKRPVHAHG